jgi:hypothetical protein
VCDEAASEAKATLREVPLLAGSLSRPVVAESQALEEDKTSWHKSCSEDVVTILSKLFISRITHHPSSVLSTQLKEKRHFVSVNDLSNVGIQ